ncbi:MAG: chromosome segregation protein SMC [Nitrospiraceae bacterium]|nr:MAG: chromosome segregation protein SMC [Nitrospiraceae bacterium]
MRVERLELTGFKSFADKTVFNFHSGITAIVGPNGCGKSNVVDAFRWVLGEQSAKSLRGDSMEDVIFLGSATKKTKGMAEVTLVLSDITRHSSNGSGDESRTAISEISVTRRLYRSGESEYLMNKVQCRLKDIKNMFLDTGLELKAYSILEQGKMDHILSSKPQDRRFLIEEVAGVMKYKVRRTEALNKLEASRSNLQRLQDIIAEVKRQISTIDRHAKKAERYKKLLEEIKDIELRIAKRDSKALRDEISGLVLSEDAFKVKEAGIVTNLHATEALMEEKKRLCADDERRLGEIKMRLYSIEKEVAEDEGKTALLRSDCDNLRERTEALLRRDGELAAESEDTVRAIREMETARAEMTGELGSLGTMLEDKTVVFSEAENGITALERDLETLRKDLFSKAEETSALKNEMSQLSLRIENISRKAEKSSQDIGLLKDSLSSLLTATGEAQNERLRAEEELVAVKNVKEALFNKLREKKMELSANEETLHREREEAAAMSSKLESLRELDQLQRSSLDEKVKALCQVADIFETSSRYETALEAVLGDKLNAAVVTDRNEIMGALRHISERKSKRSGFITFNSAPAYLPARKDVSGSGIIGKAGDFVTVKEDFRKIAEALLHDVVLVDDLGAAFSLRETHDAPFYFVTLNGEVLEPSGMVFGGSGKEVLKVKRMVKELEQDISAKKLKISADENAVSANREEIVSLENDIISADGKIFSQEKYRHALEVKLAGLDEEKERLRKKHEYISLEITDDYAEKDNLKKLLEEKDGVRLRLESEKLEIEGSIMNVQETLSGRKEALEKIRSGLTEIKLNLASIREKIASAGKELGRLNDLVHEIENRKRNMAAERSSIEESIHLKEQEISEKEDAVKGKIISAGELRDEVSGAEETLESRHAELAVIEKQQKSLSAELESVRVELNHAGMKKMELSMKLNYLKEDILKTYSLEIETADIADTVSVEEEEDLARLRERLQEIGPVSLGTLDEYEELKSRYEFLTKQRDDLQTSIDALQDTIQKINRTTQQRLTEAFNALNEKFREVFTTLFGKGRAELHLTGEESILDAGIEIVAQPPGKKLQNLMLLSGGEKALTALSLLFAGFMIKPTPQCILDEVDAPLDESNTGRFISLLKKLSENIQFITITHNRRTMEAANYIYGITMEEPGSSKVVSMHMADTV